MFETLTKMTDDKIIIAVDTLNRGEPICIRVDPKPIYVVFLSSASRGLPYEVDFMTVGEDMETPVALKGRDLKRCLTPWVEDAVKRICRVWRERHPEA